MRQNFLLLFCCFIFYNVCNAQKIITSSGNSFSNSNIRLDFTIGEPIVTTTSNSSLILTQGFQQPTYQILTKITKSLKEILKLTVFPNPTDKNVIIKINDLNNNNILLDIYDINGKILESNILINTENYVVDISKYAVGTYFFSFRDKTENLQSTFNIIKSK